MYNIICSNIHYHDIVEYSAMYCTVKGIGANSGPAGFVHSFKCIRKRNTAFPRFFVDFICHVQHYVSHFASLSPMKYGLCILFLLRSTSTQRLRPTRCFFGHFFFASCIHVKRFGSFLLPALPVSLSFDFCYCISKRNSTHNSLIFLNLSLYNDPSWPHCMECSVSTVSTFDLTFGFH